MGSYLNEIKVRQQSVDCKRKEFNKVISCEEKVIEDLVIKDIAEQIIKENLMHCWQYRRTYVERLSSSVKTTYGIYNSRIVTRCILGACDLLGISDY